MSGSSVGRLRTTVLGPLVRAVCAVSVAVAGPQAGDTNGVVALEGRGAAGDAWAGGLVAAVITVRLVVTHEGRRHALAIPAAELGVCALPWCTAVFISSILTVSFSITAPGAWYTLVKAVRAAELCRSARFGHAGTRKFISAVSAVVRAVTHPSRRYTFPIPTLELPGSTCCQCICLQDGAEEKQQ